MAEHDEIALILKQCNELSAFCHQNGWIIDDSIRYDILETHADNLLISVTFLESIMEGSGCQADQKPCYGRLRLLLGNTGNISGIEIV